MTRVIPFVLIVALAACSFGTSETPGDEGAVVAGDTAPAQASDDAETAGEEVVRDEPPATATGADPSPGPALPSVKPVPAQLPAVVASVNGEDISGAELEMAVREIEARAGQPVPDGQRDQVFREALDQLIGYRLLLQESFLREVVVTEAEIDARIGQVRAQFPSDETFMQALAMRQMTLDMLRTEARKGMQVDAMLEAELGTQPGVTADEVEAFYAANPSQFQQGERVRASHILIGFPDGADDAAREAVRSTAADLLGRLRAGEDFAALAKEYSQDPGSGVNGGDLGYFERGQMVPPFEEAAFSLAPGETSGLVESPFGFHIIRLVDRQAARTVPLDEIRAEVQQYLEAQRRDRQTQAFVDGLKAKSNISIYI